MFSAFSAAISTAVPANPLKAAPPITPTPASGANIPATTGAP